MDGEIYVTHHAESHPLGEGIDGEPSQAKGRNAAGKDDVVCVKSMLLKEVKGEVQGESDNLKRHYYVIKENCVARLILTGMDEELYFILPLKYKELTSS